MATYHVAMTNRSLHPPTAEQVQLLADADATLDARDCATPQEVIAHGTNADCLLVASAPVTAEVVARLRGCRLIAKIGSGYDNIDVKAAGLAGIPVTNVPEFCTPEVADHAMALLLDCAKKITLSDRRLRKGAWDPAGLLPSFRLEGRVLGLVGYGKIGRAVARRAAGFGLDRIACDPTVAPDEMQNDGVQPVDLDTLLRTADIVSLHLPLTERTRGLIGEQELARMKPTAILINCARGPIVEEAALVRALSDGALAGAGLDVFASEPIGADHPLCALDNVVLTPHSAAFSDEAMRDLRAQAYAEAVRALRGEPLQHVVNGEWLK